MITANDIVEHLSEINKTEDRIVDEWLTDVFLKRAVQSGVTNLTFSSESLSAYWCKYGLVFKKEFFINAMQKRNFNVVYACDDRPCGGCYYKVSIKE